jgi:hypothetical protein
MSMRKKSLREKISKKIEVVEYICAWSMISFMIVGYSYHRNRQLLKAQKSGKNYNV